MHLKDNLLDELEYECGYCRTIFVGKRYRSAGATQHVVTTTVVCPRCGNQLKAFKRKKVVK